MNSTLKNILKYAIFLGIGGALLYLAFKDAEIDELKEILRNAKYEYVVASMIMGYLAFISRGMRWVILLEPLGKKPALWNAIHAVTLGYFVNIFVPRAGELARCTALQQTDKIPVDKLFGTVILERVIDLIMLMLLVILTFILEFDRLNSFFDTAFSEGDGNGSLMIKGIIVGFGVLVLAALYFLRHKFKNLPFYSKIRTFLTGIKEGIKSISQLKSKWPFILHTLFIWTTYYLMVYICVFSLPVTEHLDPSSGLFVMIVAGFGMVIPAPGGIGSYHYLVMLALGVLGISRTDGLGFATLVHSGQVIMTVVSGIVALIVWLSVRSKNKNLQTIDPTPENG